jgi:lipopolysaccharide export system protein LptA
MKRWLKFWSLTIALTASGYAAAQGPRSAAPAPASSAAGQSVSGPSLLQNQNDDQPIQIESATLEVRDKSKMATFSGDVQVVQGDTTIKCQTLVVFYGAGPGSGPATGPGHGSGPTVASIGQSPAQGGTAPQKSPVPQGQQDIRRIEARGGVTVVSKDQNASGDLGVYDVKKKTITLTGNVVVSQGKNVLHGDRVIVDTVTGNAHIESGGTSQNRVRALILPGKNEDGTPSNFMSIGPGSNKTN